MSDLISSEELARSEVNAALEALAGQETSGLLSVEGDPSGEIYVDHGQIAFARSSWTPDVGVRLPGTLQPSAALRDLLAGGDQADRDIGTLLVRQAYLTRAELQAILRSIALDALIALTAPGDEDAFVTRIGFTSSVTHWAGGFGTVDAPSLLAEAARRARYAGRHHLGRSSPVRLHDLGRASATLTRRQWAIACLIDGTASAEELAWQAGLALYDTLDAVGALIEAGLCAACSPEAPAPPPVPPPGPLAHWFGPAPPTPQVPVTPDLLRRVLDGLRRST